ncbi:unnamed protein product [Medioppia subpectinata]|uniref:propanoyl-CoA C-acyltransferase n=1 Tax=Medioppia subpectinata TaxID=1979941 RepID=A0A7R9KU34_9ACAR|nr:unnamed protein product [Medioppia subpectinata]CAG2109706.1 unnamed protein product [Medioppia subpectinata]
MAKGRRVFVVGVGMTKFVRPGVNKLLDYPQMVSEAVTNALNDSRLQYSDVELAAVGYVFGDSTCGQKALYEIGMTGIPIVNVNNNCSTGSTALYLAKNMIAGGLYDCTIAVGFEKMERGALTSKFKDRINPMQSHVGLFYDLYGMEAAPITAQMFGAAGKEHMQRYGTKAEHFGKIAAKNHRHSVNNPYSQFREEHSLEEIMNSPKVYDILTRYQCCPTSDGSAAAILASEDFVRRHNLTEQAVEIVSMQMTTDTPSTFEEKSAIKLIGFDMTKLAAERAFAESGLTPDDIQVIELHDCFSTNELITYEALGLCPVGKGKDLVDSNQNTYGGKYVINPSGGLLSKGHPLGATGLAQCAELNWQLRNIAGARQVAGAKHALQHNIGLGGAVVVAIYRLGFPQNSAQIKTFDETFKKLKTNPDFEFQKLRHEVFKFGTSGLDRTEKREAKIAHAISLGAPRKGKYKNYKQLMEERKAIKTREDDEKEQNSQQIHHKTKIYKQKKQKRNPNGVKGFDYQIGKYRNGVQFVDKKQMKSKNKRK